jgi:hypothetical protein
MQLKMWMMAGLVGFGWGCKAPQTPAIDVGSPQSPAVDAGAPLTEGVLLAGEDGEALAAEGARLQALLDAAGLLDAEALLARAALPFTEVLGYDPLDAANLEVLQSSFLALDEAELEVLSAHGFVINADQPLGDFVTAYRALYNADLPVFVTADLLLHTLHRSFDEALKAMELAALHPAASSWAAALHQRLADGAADAWGPEAVADLDLYLTVARRLLIGAAVAPVAGADAGQVEAFSQSATQAVGLGSVVLFGTQRSIDFSQFTPRGHYDQDPALTEYFRGMLWLGRVDFRLVETMPNGERLLNRRGVRAMLALDDLLDAETRTLWTQMEAALGGLVGVQDNLTFAGIAELRGALELGAGAEAVAALAAYEPEALIEALLERGFGTQRIAGHVMFSDGSTTPLPLNLSFAPFGQRYTVDSHALSNVVWSRVSHEGLPKRMMPDVLDVAYAALGNDQAASLLAQPLETYGYAPELAGVRALIDTHDPQWWAQSTYGGWMNTLRTLSPDRAALADPVAAGLPSVFATEAWGRRLLNTQLASWAELRHDTVLYVKPSYTDGAGCDYPDGYVEPNPAFFAALVDLAERGAATAEGPLSAMEPNVGARMATWWRGVGAVAAQLRVLAEQQRTGEPMAPEQIAWLEDAVRVEDICGSFAIQGGWLAELFFDRSMATEYAPTVVDVHTQPTDAVGTPVGRVLHVGTGPARKMVITVETCQGPRAYVGAVSSTFTQVTEGFDRLTDGRWQLSEADELPWLAPVMVGE